MADLEPRLKAKDAPVDYAAALLEKLIEDEAKHAEYIPEDELPMESRACICPGLAKACQCLQGDLGWFTANFGCGFATRYASLFLFPGPGSLSIFVKEPEYAALRNPLMLRCRATNARLLSHIALCDAVHALLGPKS